MRYNEIINTNAITDAHPDAIQVSDRFHLLKNLTSYATDYLKKKLKAHISISQPHSEDSAEEKLQPLSKSDKNRKLILKEKYDQIEVSVNSTAHGLNKKVVIKSSQINA